MQIHNPIIKGFYPDPSICKAENKYYLVCSSFQYFPGVPIFESKDLVEWHQVGNCITKLSQIMLHQVRSSGGVFAPTIRYNEANKRFYMVTNNNSTNENFYMYTDNIYGEWSAPIFVDQGGIDPSLLFDNGKVYFTSNGSDEDGNEGVMQCEIDIETGEKLTETKLIWPGNGGRYLESPHLYHIGDYYYIMAAEGGTEYGHMITYARSKNPFGPFETYAKNPVLTNRNLGGHQSTIQGIGHGDLICDDNGNWFIVCLGFRQIAMWEPYHHLGREVFMAPVKFDEEGWFTAGDNGIVTECMEMDLPEDAKQVEFDEVSFATLAGRNPRWIYLRDYVKENYEFNGDSLTLTGTPITLEEVDTPTFIGVRQSDFKTSLKVKVESESKEAGITFYMDESQHYDVALVKEDMGYSVYLKLRVGDVSNVVSKHELYGKSAYLYVESEETMYHFYCSEDGVEKKHLGDARTKYLSSEVAGGFTGVVMGMYCVDSNENKAKFSELMWKRVE